MSEAAGGGVGVPCTLLQSDGPLGGYTGVGGSRLPRCEAAATPSFPGDGAGGARGGGSSPVRSSPSAGTPRTEMLTRTGAAPLSPWHPAAGGEGLSGASGCGVSASPRGWKLVSLEKGDSVLCCVAGALQVNENGKQQQGEKREKNRKYLESGWAVNTGGNVIHSAPEL